MKVVIVNCFSDSNKGSAAILWGLIYRLQRTKLVRDISVVSLFAQQDPAFESAYRHTQNQFPEISIVGSPISSPPGGNGKPEKVLSYARKLLVLPKALGRLMLPRKYAISGHAASLEIATADLVLDRGGPFFDAGRFLINPSLYSYAYPLLLARKMGVPYGFAPGSINSVENGAAKNFIRSLMEKAEFISVRDPISKQRLVDCRISPDRIDVLLDSAFWIEPFLSDRVKCFMKSYSLEGQQFLIVVPRLWFPRIQQHYHRELAKTIDYLVPHHFDKVVLVPHMFDPEGHLKDDVEAMYEVFQLIKQKEHVVMLEEDLAPNELVALYGRARLLLGTRLHSVILGLTAGIPVIAVSYQPKTQGIMGFLDLESYVLNIETFQARYAINLVEKALTEQKHVANNIETLRQENDTRFRELLKSVKP